MVDPSCDTFQREMTTSIALGSRPGILVVDDDVMIRDLLRIVLTHQGFEVLTCDSGASAVELYRKHQAGIAVVLLDVCMPDMDGPQTLTELRRISSTLCACFMSGFTPRYSTEDLLARGAAHFFEKPFQLPVLTEQLRRLAAKETRQSA